MRQSLLLLLLASAALVLAGCGSLEDPLPTARAGLANPRQPRPTATPQPTPDLSAFLHVPADNPRSKGSPNAPITIIEYSDYEWPFCKQFVRETAPQLEEAYVKRGIVRFVYRDLPSGAHPSAELAAVASRCAAAQQQFWPMHDRLFATHGQEWGGVPSRDREVMITFADELGLDAGAFERCLDDPAVTAAVQRESQQALELGINATPSFVINGGLLAGARPFELFKQVITQLQAEQ